mmetsp:Transcript_119606/g.381656  ORF Transcript_119606/g.381656 Transcript_119606/m.381656 type:complete len:183 (+) Transcript_119606:65-613(+)
MGLPLHRRPRRHSSSLALLAAAASAASALLAAALAAGSCWAAPGLVAAARTPPAVGSTEGNMDQKLKHRRPCDVRGAGRGPSRMVLSARGGDGGGEESELSRRNLGTGYFAVMGGLLAVIGFWCTRDEDTRRMKICVRSKDMEKDFFDDPEKKAWADSQGLGYLQDPECIQLSEAWEKFKPS